MGCFKENIILTMNGMTFRTIPISIELSNEGILGNGTLSTGSLSGNNADIWHWRESGPPSIFGKP